MKKFIGNCITEEQAAFLHGRSMSDHVLLAHEVFHKMKISKREKGFMAVKLDMEQAYESMCWDTLFQALNMFGFPMKLTMLIMECIRNARFAFILNGKNSKWIIAENGFRKGCPLSPFLYVICSQLLSLAIAQRGQDLGIQVSCKAHKISHLLFADDVLLFSKATKKLVVKMNNIVRDFCSWTGLRINISKSQILFSKRINRMDRIHVMKILKFKLVEEFQYLGIKLMLRRPLKANFKFLLDSVLTKLNTWGSKCLSLVGKMTLAKSSLLTLPNFISTHSLVPKKILYEIDKCCRNFIWHKRDGKKGMHFIAWKTLCK
ncbi:putative mitochondrial protein [Dendrobium catenatum]|uniref:Putative mitochondrial protein n=1 Tax=Dendrobium catenatum TaxID=906689 RepID=A0A2I0W376_9ASPA|nr:putative mitochondrial protein [Dendrobium catenatum]